MGRPFKGHVDELSKEPDVPERRSLLRGFKKFFGSLVTDKVKGASYRHEIIEDIVRGLKPE